MGGGQLSNVKCPICEAKEVVAGGLELGKVLLELGKGLGQLVAMGFQVGNGGEYVGIGVGSRKVQTSVFGDRPLDR